MGRGLCIFVKCKDGNLLLYITVNQPIAFVKRIKDTISEYDDIVL